MNLIRKDLIAAASSQDSPVESNQATAASPNSHSFTRPLIGGAPGKGVEFFRAFTFAGFITHFLVNIYLNKS
jgi:hypothetical protein